MSAIIAAIYAVSLRCFYAMLILLAADAAATAATDGDTRRYGER